MQERLACSTANCLPQLIRNENYFPQGLTSNFLKKYSSYSNCFRISLSE